MSATAVTVLGATGSVGVNTLDVIARNPARYRVEALTAHRDVEGLARLAARHGARLAVVADPRRLDDLAEALRREGSDAEAMAGPEALIAAATLADCDIVVAAIVGAAGLRPTLAAARAGKRIALANKESMIIAGPLFHAAVRDSGAVIVPVDSEHNALFQALPPDFHRGLAEVGVEKLILTASGGPFLHRDAASLEAVTPDEACRHPNWDMGRKISVDSATLMNKGLEVIEARWLFDAEPDRIEVVVHPQSIVHSLVAFRDGSVLAQLGNPDMRTPIAHALAWPERIEAGVKRLDLARVGPLEFHPPDLERFPCLAIAFDVLRDAPSATVVLNAANESAVEAFLNGAIGFRDIPAVIADVVDRVATCPVDSLEDIMDCDARAREAAAQRLAKHD